jgi:adenylylsulfate kinase
MTENIHPIFDKILSRTEKQLLLSQKSIVIWMVGLSGSGKSTIAKELEKSLYEKGFLTQLLDGDNLRTGINNNLSFSESDRIENIRRSAEVAKLFCECGIITICSFISPTAEIRALAKNIVGNDFNEVFINTTLEECEKRDVKGLYHKARKGEIKNFTGIDSPFEAPLNPDISISTINKTIEESKNELLNYILPKISLN